MTAKRIDETHTQIELGESDSSGVVCLTLLNKDTGKRARAWLSCVIRPNGRPMFTLNTLGRSKESDRSKSACAAWHTDLG